jgi:hypothetical protein
MHAARVLSGDEPIRLVLTVPLGVRARHLASGDGFGSGYDVSIERSAELVATDQAVPVRIAVYVPMTDPTVAVRVSFVPAGSVRLSPDDARATDRDALDLRARSARRTLAPGSATGTANEWIAFATLP